MPAVVDNLSAVRVRAKRRFRDHDVDLAYQVCLPVYDLRIRVVEHETGKLSTAARFVLMLANVPVTDVSEIRRLLGLSEGEVVLAAAEVLSAALVEQQPDSEHSNHGARAYGLEGGWAHVPPEKPPSAGTVRSACTGNRDGGPG